MFTETAPNRHASLFKEKYISDRVKPGFNESDLSVLPSLMVRLDEKLAGKLLEPEDLIAAAKAEKNQSDKKLLQRLRDPLAIAPVIRTERLVPALRKEMKQRAAKGLSDINERRVVIDDKIVEEIPVIKGFEDPEVVMHEFFVLYYANEAERDAALADIKKDPFFRVARKAHVSNFSNDPLYSSYLNTNPLAGISGQWGPHAMSMGTLWSLAPGHGTIGIVDSGTTPTHPDLTKSLRAHRSWNADPNGALCTETDINESGRQGINITASYGHGTHVHGVVAAEHSNSTGIRGQCARCSVQVAKITSCNGASGFAESTAIDAARRLIRSGANIINMSFGSQAPRDCGSAEPPAQLSGVTYNGGWYSGDSNDAYCALLRFASNSDVQIVAAAGNSAANTPQFPARDPRALAVGGMQLGTTSSLSNFQIWNAKQWKEQSPARVPSATAEIGTNYGTNLWVVAPARDIVSTMVPNTAWNEVFRCGTKSTFGPGDPSEPFQWLNAVGGIVNTAPGLSAGSNPGNAYGVCTGTSMAAPHVTGLLGVMRSAIPLMNAKSYQAASTQQHWMATDMRSLIKTSSRIPDGAGNYYGAGLYDPQWGFGIPQGMHATNLLSQYSKLPFGTETFESPLLELESDDGNDFLFTSSPTMAAAGFTRGLAWPRVSESRAYCGSRFAWKAVTYYRNPNGGLGKVPWGHIGTTGGNAPPQSSNGVPPPITSCNMSGPENLRATLKIFTTPTFEGVPLNVLNRYSVVFPDGVGGYAMRHVYASRSPTAPTNEFTGWTFDGVEGYIYPPTLNGSPTGQPRDGMEEVWLMVRASTFTYVLSPATQIPAWQSRGFQIEPAGSACAGCSMGWAPRVW